MDQRFGGMYHLYPQGRISTERENSVLKGGHVCPKCRFTYGLHGAIAQIIATFSGITEFLAQNNN
jgi:hypothetical protein